MKNQPLVYHLGIIPDGNRRWAKKHHLPLVEGHRKGVKIFEKLVDWCKKRNIKVLTCFAFSTENWKRPKKEIDFLMRLIASLFEKDALQRLKNKGVRIRIIGEMDKVPGFVKKVLKKVEKVTKDNKEIIVNLAFSYGGRGEILRAVKEIVKKKIPSKKINEEIFSRYLFTSGLPDPDLIIRTGGHQRLSNFLLWQSAYSELYFLDKYWPDFEEKDLDEALKDFASRKRNFGR